MRLVDMTSLRLIVAVVAILGLVMLVGCKGGNSCRKSLEDEPGSTGIGSPSTGGSGGTTPPSGGGNPGSAEGVDLYWVVPQGTSTADKQWLANRIKTVLAENFWEASEGQAYLCNQTIQETQPTPYGEVNFVVCRSMFGANGGFSQANCETHRRSGAYYFDIWMSHGDGGAQNWLHEIGHGYFGMNGTEEYKCRTYSPLQGCPMASCESGDPDNEKHRFFCDKDTCYAKNTQGIYQQCWNKRILARHPNWQHPGPLGKHGTGGTPTCSVTIK